MCWGRNSSGVRLASAECGRTPLYAPGIEHSASVGHRREQRLVQALVAQPAYEALHEGVLLRFARRNVVPRERRSSASTSGSPCWSAPWLSETQALGLPRARRGDDRKLHIARDVAACRIAALSRLCQRASDPTRQVVTPAEAIRMSVVPIHLERWFDSSWPSAAYKGAPEMPRVAERGPLRSSESNAGSSPSLEDGTCPTLKEHRTQGIDGHNRGLGTAVSSQTQSSARPHRHGHSPRQGESI
jgi:hypothetical protein